MNVVLSNLLIRPEPDDYLEPNKDLTVDQASTILRPFIPIYDKRMEGRWYKSMTGHNDINYIVTGIGKNADAMMEYKIYKNE